MNQPVSELDRLDAIKRLIVVNERFKEVENQLRLAFAECANFDGLNWMEDEFAQRDGWILLSEFPQRINAQCDRLRAGGGK